MPFPFVIQFIVSHCCKQETSLFVLQMHYTHYFFQPPRLQKCSLLWAFGFGFRAKGYFSQK
uniref:Uncharacterized protein n=1 Tax=Anguilla anguilla TaxID=7936 RepID=A0A0E9WVE7_ANGAN